MKQNYFRKVLLLLAMLIACHVSAQTNEKLVSVKVTNATLDELFASIEKQTTYKFSFRNIIIDSRPDITVDMKNVAVGKVLDKALENRKLRYEILSPTSIVIAEKIEQAPKQEPKRSIRGVVKDQNGEPVVGASIVVEGTQSGTVTDIEGKFAIDVTSGNVLNISYLSYVSQSVKVANQTSIEVVMQESAEFVDEIVVVGYGTQKKQNLTGSTVTVNMDKVLGNRPISSVTTALRGAAPGLTVTSSNGVPGASNSWNVRGATGSINGNASPLVLVDNVEMDINLLNPNDIETVSILKDAASSAIYGARAAFGVVLITTKKGSNKDRFNITFNANWAFSKPMNLPQKATPWQTVKMYNDIGDYAEAQNPQKWLQLIEDYNSNPSKYPDGYVMGNVDDGDAGTKYSLKQNDLFGEMFSSNGYQQMYDVAADGGSKKLSYRMSFGYVDEDGVLITDKDSYRRYNVSSYIRSDALDWIKPELDIKYVKSEKQLPDNGYGFGIFGGAVAFPSYYSSGEKEIDGVTYMYNSPANIIKNSYPRKTTVDDSRITGRITVIPLKDWNIVGEITSDHKFSQVKAFNPINTYIRAVDDLIEDSTTAAQSKYELTDERTSYTSMNLFSTYSFKLGQKNNFKLMAGYSQESKRWEQHYSWKSNMINQLMPSISGGVGEVFSSDAITDYTIRSGFFRFNYNYDEKYLLEVNGRYDGSSKFPTSSRFGFFPSVSAGWRISQESFWKPIEQVVNTFKIRGSYGTIGNQNINPYQWVPGMDIVKAGWYVDSNYVYTLTMPALVSTSFTWEKVNTLDFGFDAGFLNNTLNVTFDWYRRDTNGMLAQGSEKPALLGTSAPLENVADLRTNGWELAVNYNGRIGDNWTYSLGLSLYDSRTKITKYDNVAGLYGSYYVGKNIGEIWGYETDRYYTSADFNQDGTLIEGTPYVKGYSNPNPGDVLYKDLDQSGRIDNGTGTLEDPGDTKVIGNSTPRYQYGINGNLGFKGFTLSFLLQGVGKRDLWVSNELFWPWYDEYSTIMASQLDYWTESNQNAYFPRIYYKAKRNTAANHLTQTKYLQNGAYLSIRNISLSYDLPKSVIKPILLSNATVFVSGENIAIFHHLPQGMNPEAENRQRGWTYPYLTKWSMGIRLTF